MNPIKRIMLALAVFTLCISLGCQGSAEGRRFKSRPSPGEPAIELDVPYVPTAREVVNRMLDIVKIQKDDVVYDLGCGDGRIVITAAERVGSRGIGIDIDPRRIREAKKNAKRANVEKLVEFKNQDLFETDFSAASVVTLYLLPDINIRLRPILLEQLRPGTRIISHDYTMGDWAADLSEYFEYGDDADRSGYSGIYYWVVPAKVDGAWELKKANPAGEEGYDILFGQEYQNFSVAVTKGSAAIAKSSGKLSGTQISFNIHKAKGDAKKTLHFRGEVQGDSMAGKVTENTGATTVQYQWSAKRKAAAGDDQAKDKE